MDMVWLREAGLPFEVDMGSDKRLVAMAGVAVVVLEKASHKLLMEPHVVQKAVDLGAT